MHHYIALMWSPTDSEQLLKVSRIFLALGSPTAQWTRLVNTSSLAIYSGQPVDGAMRTYLLPNSGGAVFGRLFPAPSGNEVKAPLSLADARQIIASQGRYLLTHFWGNYVAVFSDHASGRSYVVRDCSGRIPCYYVTHHGIRIFFSSLPDLAPLGLKFTISDQYLVRMILRHPLHVRDTALNEVQEVLPGECVAISGEAIQQYPMWTPQDFVLTDTIDDYSQALSRLRRSTENVIASWASLYDRILLYLSGGLDSAIVLGCLNALGMAEKVVCINHFTAETRDDERDYARAAAKMSSVTLNELPRRVPDGRNFLESIQSIPLQPKPDVPHVARILIIDEVNGIAQDSGCNSVWTGQGGDHIFFQAAHQFGAADYLLQRGLTPHFPAAIYDSALLDRNSIWTVLWTSLRYRFHLGTDVAIPDEFEADGTEFLTASRVAAQTDITCGPWTDVLHRLPPGKRLQTRELGDLLNRHKPLVGVESPFEQHPLISQPLLETSLRIPTYQLQRGGRQRSMARRAFSEYVPTCILEREDKGDTDDYIRSLLRGTAPFLRGILLDGILVSRGILDRSALERVLFLHDTYKMSQTFPLLCCIAAEIWARNSVRSSAKASVDRVLMPSPGSAALR